MTRRNFIIGSAVAVSAGAATALGSLSARSGASRAAAGETTPIPTPTPAPTALPGYPALVSRPDLSGAPAARVLASTGRAQSGYLFATPDVSDSVRGPCIFANDGSLLFYHPVTADLAHNFQVVEYQGQSMLAWYEGAAIATYGEGAYYLYDNEYQQVAVIQGENGSPIDLHELVVTPEGTALVGAYIPVEQDLTAIGGLATALVYDYRLQEIDIASGRLLFDWHALDHVPLTESAVPVPTDEGDDFDYFHGNAIDVTPDGGHLVLSARNTSTIYKIDRQTGDIVWRFRGADDGKTPQDAITLSAPGESFWFQHDVRAHADGTFSLFDDGGEPFHHNARGMLLSIDEDAGTGQIIRTDTVDIAVGYMGSYRSQANGDWLAGWGNVPRLTEFAASGDVVLDMEMSGYSYRALRYDWQSVPAAPPDIAATRNGSGGLDVWASWNGATGVASWRILAGPSANALSPLQTFPLTGFETAMTVPTDLPVVACEALDADGSSLGTSAPVTVPSLAAQGRAPMVTSSS